MNKSINDRIAKSLTDAATTADQLEKLIDETDAEIIRVDQEAKIAHDRAMDVHVVDDTARQTAIDNTYRGERYRKALQELTVRHAQVKAAAYAKDWNAQADAVEAEATAMGEEFSQKYFAILVIFQEICERSRAIDQRVNRINSTAPNSSHRRLNNLHFAAAVLKNIKLPDPAHPMTEFIWPVPTPPILPEQFMPTNGDPRRFSGEWWQLQQEEEEKARQQKLAEQQRLQAERDANYRGPGWWEGEVPGPERRQG
jgi:hypothetical protein